MNKFEIIEFNVDCSLVLVKQFLSEVKKSEVTPEMLVVTMRLRGYNEKTKTYFEIPLTMNGKQILESPTFVEKIPTGKKGYIQLYRISDIDRYIGRIIQFMLGAGIITEKQFCDYCLNYIYDHLKYKKLDIGWQRGSDFFDNFVPLVVREKHKFDFTSFLTSAYPSIYQLKVEGIKTTITVGGYFKGCFTDELGRKRPLTEPKRQEDRYKRWAEMIVALYAEMGMFTDSYYNKCTVKQFKYDTPETLMLYASNLLCLTNNWKAFT